MGENGKDTIIKAKADLEARIAEKLSKMSETDLEELFALHEQQLHEKREKERQEQKPTHRKKAVAEQLTFPEIMQQEETPETLSEEQRDEPVELQAWEEDLQDWEAELQEVEQEELFPVQQEQHQEPEEPLDGQQRMKLSEAELGFRVDEFLKGYDLFKEKSAGILRGSGSFFQTCGEKIKILGAGGQKVASAAGRKCSAGMGTAYGKVKNRVTLSEEKPKEEQKKIRKMKYFLLHFKRRFIKREKMASNRMALFINRMDKRNDAIARKTLVMYLRGGRRFNFAREWAELNKKKLLALLMIVLCGAIGTTAVINHFTAYAYAYNGRVLGMVKNQEDVLRILDVVSKQLTLEHGTEIAIDPQKDISFTRVRAINQDIDDMQDVLNRLTYMQDMNARAYAIYIGGKRTAILDTKERAEGLLQTVKDLYTQQPQNAEIDYESVSFAEAVNVEPIDTKLGRLENPDDVMKQILTGAVEQRVHLVQKGETFSGIAKMYGMSQADLEKTNPGINPAKLQIEQQIILTQAVPLLTVQTVEVATYIEPMPFETTYVDNPNIFKGEKTTKVQGVLGERQVTARIIRNNGIEVGKVELASSVIKEPVTAVMTVGTKNPPPLQGTGHFILPVNGARVTSKFGMRWGRMHNGIDLACSTGTRISASDGGTVIFAGYNGSLGYTVKIDHGGNLVTLYGHCSKLLVKKNEKVYQGQHIANVGNTGRSTGPHCHFEIQYKGTPKNPYNYL